MGGRVDQHKIIGLGVSSYPVEFLLDVLGGCLLIRQEVNVLRWKASDGGIFECIRNSICVCSCEAQRRDAAVGELADADHESPLLLHRAHGNHRGAERTL